MIERTRFDAPARLPLESISVVIPVYNEEESLDELHERLSLALSGLTSYYEIIFVDDGSTDGSAQVMERIWQNDSHVRLLHLRRNFGKATALATGFAETHGDIVITMDADLQDDPDELPRLVECLRQGYDVISGWKQQRCDPLSKTAPSRVFNWVVSRTTGLRMHDFNCGLKAYRQEVVKNLRLYGELHRFVPVLAHSQGYRVTELPVTHHPRQWGKSKYGIERLLRGFFDLMTVLFLTRYLHRPLHLFGAMGLLVLMAGLGINAYLSVLWLYGSAIGHRPLLSLGILLVVVGIQLISTGLIAELVIHLNRQEDKVVDRRFE
jgi:glycosyltransferase involved in cell wall biosynthesis